MPKSVSENPTVYVRIGRAQYDFLIREKSRTGRPMSRIVADALMDFLPKVKPTGIVVRPPPAQAIERTYQVPGPLRRELNRVADAYGYKQQHLVHAALAALKDWPEPQLQANR